MAKRRMVVALMALAFSMTTYGAPKKNSPAIKRSPAQAFSAECERVAQNAVVAAADLEVAEETRRPVNIYDVTSTYEENDNYGYTIYKGKVDGYGYKGSVTMFLTRSGCLIKELSIVNRL